MKQKVINKQNNSRYCLVCGTENNLSLGTRFYETDKGELVAVFTPLEEHQSYPGITHGGISSAILDETIGRAIMLRYEEDVWGVTVELNLRYKKPVPQGQELKCVARITEERGALFEGTGELLLPDGTVAVSGRGKYLKRRIGDITDDSFSDEEWFALPDDVEELSIP